MTPLEARKIDRLEFEADCRAARERVFARIAERHGAERARVLRWIERKQPKTVFVVKTVAPVPHPKPARKRGPHRGGARHVGNLSMTLKQWADYLGITYNSLNQRIHKLGSLEAAVAEGGPKRRTGVVANFPEPVGTGGGPVAQHFSQLEFSE